MNGEQKYVLHFSKEELPPVEAFWSVTMYDAKGYQAANDINRFAVSSWMPFKYNADGSLDLTIQNETPVLTRKRTGCRPRRDLWP